jgi:hypothetical protein
MTSPASVNLLGPSKGDSIPLTGANITIDGGVLFGQTGFTLIRRGHREDRGVGYLVPEEPRSPWMQYGCARCDDEAVIQATGTDWSWELLCRGHGYAGTWMTWAEFHERVERYQASGMPGDAIAAFALWAFKRIRN